MDSARRLHALVDRLGATTVVIVGDLVLDRFILGTPKRISREAPVIILRYEGQRDIPGGGANALANLAALDVHVLPIGVVGDDEPGTSLRRELAQRGIDVSGIVSARGFRTPTKIRILGGGPSSLMHQVARYDVEDQLDPSPELRQQLLASLARALPDAHAAAISDYGYGTVQPFLLEALCNPATRPPWVCVDSRARLPEYHGIDAATPNLGELEPWAAGDSLVGDDDVARAAEALRDELGSRFVLATRGNRGMTLAQAALAPVHIPVFGTDQVADVTGAGDTVLAVLTAALAAGASPLDAATLANYAGGIVVMKLGTATVSRDELHGALRTDAGV